jgi:hypothetical protein
MLMGGVFKMTTKLQQQSKIDYTELLLRNQNKTVEVIERAKKHNIENGFNSKTISFIAYDKTMRHEKYERWLAAVTSPQSNGRSFYTCEILKQNGLIPDEETPHDGKKYPIRELTNLTRYKKSDGKEWLVKSEQWTGIDRENNELSITVADLDFYIYPRIIYRLESSNPNAENSPKTRIAVINGDKANPAGEKIYLTPFSEDAVSDALQYVTGPFDNPYHRSLALMKDNASRPTGVRSIQEFLTPSFDEIWRQNNTPEHTINLDSKVLSRLTSPLGEQGQSPNQKQYQ